MTYYREPTYEISFMFRRILVPVDGSANSMKALEVALDFAKRYGSKVTILIVNDGMLNVDDVVNVATGKARRAGVDVGIRVRDIRNSSESVVSKIIDEISEGGYDLIIVGARGRTVSESLLVGSTALSVIINSPVSCLVVR